MEKTKAIVMAMFGTSVEEALPGLLSIRSRMEQEFSGSAVRLAFTSQVIRRIWHQRSKDPQYRSDHPGIPEEVFTVQEPLAVISSLRGRGCNGIVVQPVYMSPGEEYRGLVSLVASVHKGQEGHEGSSSEHMAVGRPALGVLGPGPDVDDIIAAARAMTGDVEYAKEKDAALVFMGHGSKDFSTEEVYREFNTAMKRLYPDQLTVVATVESSPTIEEAIPVLQANNIHNIILKPFMVVAGDHVRKDMTGPKPRGWKIRLEEAGFSVEAVVQGLGEQNAFAEIFVKHAADAAAAAGIELN